MIPLGPLLSPGEDLGSALEEVAGTRVRRMGGAGSFTALSLRGSSYRQVEYYLDGLPLNPERITLVRQPQTVPTQLHLNDAAGQAVTLVPFHGGEQLSWSLAARAGTGAGSELSG